jgi:preprotein translocase subunit YajC
VSNWGSLIPLVLVVIAFWLLVLRPARNRQKDFMATQQALTPGSRVMLASGIFGELVSVEDDEVKLRIAPDVVVDVARQAVAKVIEPEDASDDEASDESTDEHPDTH